MSSIRCDQDQYTKSRACLYLLCVSANVLNSVVFVDAIGIDANYLIGGNYFYSSHTDVMERQLTQVTS